MRIEILEESHIEKKFARTNYKLISVVKEFRRPEQPTYYRVQLTQICPLGHASKKRWNGKITCQECALTKVRVNKEGLYIDKVEHPVSPIPHVNLFSRFVFSILKFFKMI